MTLAEDYKPWAERLAHYWPDCLQVRTREEFRERFADRIKFYDAELQEFAKVVLERAAQKADALIHPDSSAEYNTGCSNAADAIRALKGEP